MDRLTRVYTSLVLLTLENRPDFIHLPNPIDMYGNPSTISIFDRRI